MTSLMLTASVVSTVAMTLGILLIAFAVYWFASALVTGARRHEDHSLRVERKRRIP